MKIYALPPENRGKGLLFDFDSTLYTNPAYQKFQNDVLIDRFARLRGISSAEAHSLVDQKREADAAAGLGRTSLGNVLLSFGIPIGTSVAWREELIRPGDWLRPDPQLVSALSLLKARFALCLVTNNPRSVGRAGLEALGAAGLFDAVIGLDDTLRSKPDPAPYRAAAEALQLSPTDCISIGDRYDVDLAPALALGMGAILVDGAADVYGLPGLLPGAGSR